jgi:hypothetical protein
VTRVPRVSTQPLLPLRRPSPGTAYDLYPAFPLVEGRLDVGWPAIAAEADGVGLLLVDGGAGVAWDAVQEALTASLADRGRHVRMRRTSDAFQPEREIAARLAASLGGDDPLFGTRFQGRLEDLLDLGALQALGRREITDDLVVVFGPGAALVDDAGPLVYLEVPRNEQQYRARAGALVHLGASRPAADPRAAYKRSYFVDWPLLERHKAALWHRVERFVDVQREACVSVSGDGLRASLDAMARAPFRARPWFEPGAWGGQWLRRHVPDLPRDVPNYAWSFELISPENGLLLEHDGLLLETGFDSLMIQAAPRVLGHGAARFGRSFPIRFDHLDTVEGGNLSVQVHPSAATMQRRFGEPYPQDETYYVLDAMPDARVYLGFQTGVTREAWGETIRASARDGTAVDVERWVRTFPANRGDLFLIPNGTVHAAGSGTLVLEISATPYIFTFKLYDWLRLDLDGRPRPLNVERGLPELAMERQGARVETELLVRPRPLDAGPGWRRESLPTHEAHFYDVHRLTVSSRIDVPTDGSPHVLNLVDGDRATVEVANGPSLTVRFAETFVVPAAAERYRVVNEGPEPAVLVCAFLKPGAT